VKKLLLPLVLLVLALPSSASPAAKPPAPYAGECGLANAQPLWFEFGWPDPAFDSILGKAGVAIGASSGSYPSQMRARGTATVYFDLHLNNRVGSSAKPFDPSLIATKAKGLFDGAVRQTGCQTPVIVENELAGPSLVTPWSDNYAQYRANVLALLQQLASSGAHPVLLIPKAPYTGGDAGEWWTQVARVAEIVREIYVPANLTWKQGAVLGNRNLRNAYRHAVTTVTDAGIPPNRVGIMVSFATTQGFGGRNGLSPPSAWYDVAKWQALAAKQVAAETGLASIWSWGWGEWNAAEKDPAKPYAMCAWMWARSPTFCNAPKAIGASFDASLKEGQLSLLPAGTQCLVGKRSLRVADVSRLQAVTGDPASAFSAAYERLVESTYTPVSPSEVLRAERAVIAQSFGGSRSAYVAALRNAHATVAVARGVLGDELRRARVEDTLFAPKPSASEVETFYSSYPELDVRLVQVAPRPSWLPSGRGLALSQVAPDRVFTLPRGKASVVRTGEGEFRVKALGDAQPLGAVPLAKAKPAIEAALREFARGDQFERWTVGKQRFALNGALCRGDDLPQPSTVDLTTYLPFLRLG
jgi:hypothetical protein